MNILSLFVTFAGFVIGLGAVTVIDLHGFLGRKSPYWTEATIRTHKVTKPLIWIGIMLVIAGHVLMQRYGMIDMSTAIARYVVIAVMIVNGCFLSFVVSPELLRREEEGRSTELLPKSFQNKITLSFIISFISWWGLLLTLVASLVQ